MGFVTLFPCTYIKFDIFSNVQVTCEITALLTKFYPNLKITGCKVDKVLYELHPFIQFANGDQI